MKKITISTYLDIKLFCDIGSQYLVSQKISTTLYCIKMLTVIIIIIN